MGMAAASDGQHGAFEVDEDRTPQALHLAWGDAAGDRWQAASYRCSCGFADDDADEFGRHLDAAKSAESEHFEVVDGWTLPQVREWQAAPVMTAVEHLAGVVNAQDGQHA
jgi:hypothetical protein